jgi:hypothetical protein
MAQSNSTIGWDAFKDFTKVFYELLVATDSIADNINKAKFVGFLNEINSDLVETKEEKESIFDLLSSYDCSDKEAGDLIDRSVHELDLIVHRLSTTTRTFANAIKPSQVRNEALQVGNKLSEIHYSKLWLYNVQGTYCERDIIQRQQTLNDIQKSIALVEITQDALNDLLVKLGK